MDRGGINKDAHKAQGDRSKHWIILRRILNPVELIPSFPDRVCNEMLNPVNAFKVQPAEIQVHEGLYQAFHPGGDRLPGIVP